MSSKFRGRGVYFFRKRANIIYQVEDKFYTTSSKEFIDFNSKSRKFDFSVMPGVLDGNSVLCSPVKRGYLFSYDNENGNNSEVFIRRLGIENGPDASKPNKFKLVVPSFKSKKRFVSYNSDGESITVAYSDDLDKWEEQDIKFLPRKSYFDRDNLNLAFVTANKKEIMVFYYSTYREDEYSFGVMAFSRRDPTRLLYRSEKPLYQTKNPNEEEVRLFGTIYAEDHLYLYWNTKNGPRVTSLSFALSETHPKVHKVKENPILVPSDNDWESEYVFNAGAFEHEGDVHLLYRAIGKSGLSVVGHAISENGVGIHKRHLEPAYKHTDTPDFSKNSLAFCSGGGFGGCEDPRVTKIGDRVYMTYTAFDGYPRVALTSIKVKDLISKKWKWDAPVIISPPRQIHKNWVIFPEKINGKYAILHSISPEVSIEYRDDLKFKKGEVIESNFRPVRSNDKWYSSIRGVGAPPILTEKGWLVFYHANDKKDPGHYKLGAMILDKDNPEKILHNSTKPVIIPDQSYENEGFKPGIVYNCGAAILGNDLHVYYGGADSVLCVAKRNVSEFVNEISSSAPIQMQKMGLKGHF